MFESAWSGGLHGFTTEGIGSQVILSTDPIKRWVRLEGVKMKDLVYQRAKRKEAIRDMKGAG